MVRRYLAIALTALAVLGCDKKKEDEVKGSTTGAAAARSAGSAGDDPWDPKPKNADAPPPPLASRLGAGAGDQLARLAGPADAPAAPDAPPETVAAAPATTPVSAATVSTDGLPTQAIKGFAGVAQTGFRVAYARSTNPLHEQFRAVLEEHAVFELVARGLNQTIRMPRTVDIHLVDCGAVNAFYDPDHGRIIVCYELLAYFVDIFKGNVASDDQLGQAVIGATLFGFYHELGHALIHQLDLPAMGREEDTADQIATLLLMEAGDDGVGMALSGAYWFHLQQKSGNETPFWDEHAFDGQRYYNILCLIYGSDPAKYEGFVASGNLPPARAQRCSEELQKIRSSFQKLIAPHLTLGAAQDADGFEAPEAPAEPAGHAITCEQVAEKAIALIAAAAEKELGTLAPEPRAQAVAEIEANLPAFLEQFLAQCRTEDWPDADRRCVLDAPTLARASRCGIE